MSKTFTKRAGRPPRKQSSCMDVMKLAFESVLHRAGWKLGSDGQNWIDPRSHKEYCRSAAVKLQQRRQHKQKAK